MAKTMQSSKRINISLPEDTLDLLDQVAKKGEKSQLFAEALRYYVAKVGKKKMQNQLKEAALKRGKRDLALAGEWFVLAD